MLHVHRCERANRLVEGLADLLRDPPADPRAVEVVAVPARGVAGELGTDRPFSFDVQALRG